MEAIILIQKILKMYAIGGSHWGGDQPGLQNKQTNKKQTKKGHPGLWHWETLSCKNKTKTYVKTRKDGG